MINTMASDTYRTYFVLENEVTGGLIQDVIQTCLDGGCATTDSGRTDICNYKTPSMCLGRDEAPINEALNNLSSEEEGRIELWCKDLGTYLEFDLPRPFVPDVPHISLMVWESQFKVYSGSTTKEGANQRAKQLLEITNTISNSIKPIYVYGLVEKYDEEQVRPTKEQIMNGEVSRIFWLNIFSEQMVQNLGKDKLLSAPAWKVEERPNGRVLMVVTERPRFYDTKAREIEEYLGIGN